MNGDRWVEARLASLSLDYDKGEELMIDPGKILARLQVRETARRKTQSRLIGAAVFAALGCGAVAAVITVQQETRVQPLPAVLSTPSVPSVVEPAVVVKNQHAARPEAARTTAHPLPAAPRSYKEVGSVAAPVTLEVYIDPECPPCATFYRETIPTLMAEFVNTGKAKLLYRDLPLPQHKYARLAARYANAAGLIGKYDVVSSQIIRTQAAWHQNGDVESQVSAVLSAEEMGKLHEVLDNTAQPEESIERDRAAAADDHVGQTPSIVLVVNGNRRKVTGPISMDVLRNYMEELLTK